jgi:hypothetical protein
MLLSKGTNNYSPWNKNEIIGNKNILAQKSHGANLKSKGNKNY